MTKQIEFGFDFNDPTTIKTTLDLHTGKKAAEEGMTRAVDHVEQESPGWKELAFGYLKIFIAGINTEFLGEEVRKYAEDHGLESPPDNRSWGAIMIRGAKEGLINKIGYRQCKNTKGHASPMTLWQKTKS